MLVPSDISDISGIIFQMEKLEFISNKSLYIHDESDNYILTKSSPEKEVYDVLYWAKKDIEIANIPSFIEIIHERAFHTHLKLKQVNIPDDSKLREKNSLAFAVCNELEKINIPPSLIKVGKDAFFQCNKLQIEMSDNSELSIIEENAFGNANFEKFVISSKLSNEYNNFIKNIQYSEIFLCPNPNYTLYNDDEYMLAKSSPEKENFDELLVFHYILKI